MAIKLFKRKILPTDSLTTKEKLKEGFNTFLLLLPYATLFLLFIAVPVVLAILIALTNFNVIEVPEYVGLMNFVNVFSQDQPFLQHVLPNTFKYVLIVGPGGYILSFLLAWMLAQIQKVPRTILALAIYAPSMVGEVFISVVWRTLFSGDEFGYINAWFIRLGLIERPLQFLQSPQFLMPIMIIVSLWSSMGIGFLAMLAGVLNGNEELYEAAYIDGIKNKFQEVIYITIPTMKPQMLFGAVMAIVQTFNTGFIGVALSGANPTPQNAGQLIINHIEDYGFIRYEMGYAAALSVILLIIIWLFSKVAYALFVEED